MNISPNLAILEEEEDADYSSSGFAASFTDRADSKFEMLDEEEQGMLNSKTHSRSFIDSPNPSQRKSGTSSRQRSHPASSRLSNREQSIVDMAVVKEALEHAEYPESDMTENSIADTLGEEFNDNLEIVINGY